MSFLHNAGTVAGYEAKTLRRSWFFRIFSIGALVIFTFMNIGIFSPVGDEPWELISIPSSLPLVNLYLLNIGQALVVIFLAADFMKRDKKLDTNEVLYTRSISNFEYVLGKTWGIIRLFMGLNLIILAIGLTMNIISQKMSVDLLSYFEYLLIITLPTLVFSLGLAFLLMSLLRNQAVTFLILLGIAALDMFWLWFRAGSLFDYMAFGLPVFKSGIIGFDNPELIINQRLLYFFAGTALIMGTILMFRRLPQSGFHTSLAIIILIISASAASFCGYNTWSIYKSKTNTKRSVTETNRLYEDRNFPVITAASIILNHKGKSIEGSANMKITNENKEPLNSYIFSLNPSLTVNTITCGGKELKFNVNNHIIEAEPFTALDPGKSDTLIITYSGTINESFISPDYSVNIKESKYRVAMLNVNKRQYYISEEYLLLTPEAHWYPVAALNYYPSNPARTKTDYTQYTLRVKTLDNLRVISQGKFTADSLYQTFMPESPLTGLTVAIGDYRSDTLKVDSVSYITHYFPGSDYYKKDLSELKDTLPFLVSGIMRDLETAFSSGYPFKTLTLLEVPVQFHSYPKNSTQTRAEVQPAMILLPERLSTLDNAGFIGRFENQKKRMARNNQVITDRELQIRLFNDFIRSTFISGNKYVYNRNETYTEPSRYRLGPSFYFFRNNFYSNEYPVINAIFESHLQQLVDQGTRSGYLSDLGTLSENDKANLVLRNNSFRELLEKNPGGDTLRVVLAVKGDWFFNLLRSKAGIEEFGTWFAKYCNDHAFERVDIHKFRDDLNDKFNFDFYPYLDSWFNGREQPGFLFSGLQASEIIVDERTRYLVSFTASNPENAAGLFNIAFRTEGMGGPGRRGQQMSGAFQTGSGAGFMQGRGREASGIERVVLLEPHETKRISLITDVQPRVMIINTLFAKNIPGEINMPVSEILKTKSRRNVNTSEEIIIPTPPLVNKSEIIVDNEDEGFDSGNRLTESPLKKLFGITNRRSTTYRQISQWNVPEYWQPVVLNSYYGKYVRSAVYTRAGTGDRAISWTAAINDPGYYDIHCYAGKSDDRIPVRTPGGGGQQGQGRGQQAESRFRDFQFKVYHDEGVENVTLDYENADAGWNNMGRYYLSSDSAKVVLTNQSSGRLVIGDAIRWVKVE